MSIISILGLGFGAVIVIGICVAASKIYKATKMVSPILSALNDRLPEQLAEIEENPKSVSAMTSVYLPRIQQDFPEFNYEEFKNKAELMLISAFNAISENNIDALKNASSDLTQQVKNIINVNLDGRQNEIFKDVKIHKTEIRNYVKNNGTCVITLQSAVGYHHFLKSQSGQIIKGSDSHMQQTRYDIELLYVQDVERVGGDVSAVGAVCPNCGAPVKALGDKQCPYCGGALEILNIKTWSINAFREVVK